MKKILISAREIPSEEEDVTPIVKDTMDYFQQRQQEVFVAAERMDKKWVSSLGAEPLKTFRWPISGFYRRMNYMNRVNKAIEKIKPDLIIGHGDIVRQNICYIHDCVHLAHEKIHGKKMPLTHEVGRVRELILRSQIFNVLVCNSRLMKNDLQKRFRIPEEKIEVIYPEYSPSKFNLEDKGMGAQKRKELGIKDEAIVIGLITSGNFKKRNLDLLIQTAGRIKKETELSFKVLVAGKDKKEKFLEQIQKEGLEDNFIFAPSVDQVESYYHAIDIFTLPAHIEEFGRSILEAMACGKPVVVSDTTGASELIELDSKNFILRDKTVDEFSLKLKALIENKILRDQLGRLNAETAQKHSEQARKDDFERMLRKFGYDF